MLVTYTHFTPVNSFNFAFISHFYLSVPAGRSGPRYPLIRLQALGAACPEPVEGPVSAPITNARYPNLSS